MPATRVSQSLETIRAGSCETTVFLLLLCCLLLLSFIEENNNRSQVA